MVFIDPKFRSVIHSHLVGNLAVENSVSPLILAIFGPPGEGKTFQTERACYELGLKSYVVSPGELESENAGHPGQVLRQQYAQAGSTHATNRGVLIIHDVDTVLGDWGQLVQYTVNRQVVYGQLMSFCDFPTEVAGMPTARVPIILTGNNPSILYGPLLRPGRARIARWSPTVETRLPIIASLFPEINLSELGEVVSRFPTHPVSFWSDAKATLWEESLAKWIASVSASEVARLLATRSKIAVSANSIGAQALLAVAQRLDSDAILTQSFVKAV